MTTDMPTWLTGLFVVIWIARSAALRPRKSQTSPVRVRSIGLVETDLRPACRSHGA